MLNPRSIVWLFAAGVMASGPSTTGAQDYPSRPIRIMTGTVGGGNDFASRQIVQGMLAALGQPVIIENRPTFIAAETVSKAQPDGHTLLLAGTSFWIGPLIQNLPFDPVKDFSPVTAVGSSPSLLVVHPSLPVKSVKELIALAKARPGALNYGTGGTGAPPHLGAELFKSMTGVNIVRINYKGQGAALNGLIGGEVQLMLATAGGISPHLKSGKLKALAVTSAQPSTLFPGVPTVAASGVPGYVLTGITGMFAPAKTPVAIINRLNREVERVLDQPDVKQRFFNAGVEIISSSPEQLGATVNSELAAISKLMKEVDIRAD